MTTTNPLAGLTEGLTAITTAVSSVVSSVHKEAALVLGVLSATGNVPSVTGTKYQSIALHAYAALCHVADKLGNRPVTTVPWQGGGSS